MESLGPHVCEVMIASQIEGVHRVQLCGVSSDAFWNVSVLRLWVAAKTGKAHIERSGSY